MHLKISKFYFILSEDKNSTEKLQIANLLSISVRKHIGSGIYIYKNINQKLYLGKQGEAAIKPLNDNSFICPFDTILENIKMLDDIIAQNNLKDVVKIGLGWAADNFYYADQKKYELENPNPKNFLDTDQLVFIIFSQVLISFRLNTITNYAWISKVILILYLKFILSKGIAYLEDPINSEDFTGWAKLIVYIVYWNI